MKEEEINKRAEEILGNVSTPISEGVTAIHEMFLELQKAGYTKLEALWLSGYVLTRGSSQLEDG